jgi:hypothetical protein
MPMEILSDKKPNPPNLESRPLLSLSFGVFCYRNDRLRFDFTQDDHQQSFFI